MDGADVSSRGNVVGETVNRQVASTDANGLRRLALIVTSAAAALAGVAGARFAVRLSLQAVRNVRMAMRFSYRVVTLTLYRRCPDCRRIIRADARLCLHCGYRKAPSSPRGRRARRRAERETRRHATTVL